MLYNCSAYVEFNNGVKVAKGNVTEVGLINYLIASKIDTESILNSKQESILISIPFNSTRKRATTAVSHSERVIRVFVKGAPDILIDKCTKMFDDKGNEVDISVDKKTEMLGEKIIKAFASKCYRTLMVAYADIDVEEWERLKREHNNFESVEDRECIETNLTMVGIFALMDPLRPGIREAVQKCHKSGINVRMVTGDFLDTAMAISKEAGIITAEDLANNEDGYLCMTGA